MSWNDLFHGVLNINPQYYSSDRYGVNDKRRRKLEAGRRIAPGRKHRASSRVQVDAAVLHAGPSTRRNHSVLTGSQLQLTLGAHQRVADSV